jgi:carbamoyltransferase
MAYTLALHAGHNSSAVIGDERGVAYAVQEERLTGEKNFWGFPRLAVRACLDHVGIKAKDVARVAYGGHQVFARYHSRDDILKAYKRHDTLAGKLRQRVAMPLVLAFKKDFGQSGLEKLLASEGLAAIPRVHYEHHLCHAASAYYGLRQNPDDRYLVVTADGSGDDVCSSVRVFGGGRVDELAATHWDNSLGALYSWVTYAMGFMPFEHEYKLMGMAPYASHAAAEEAAKIFRRYLGFGPGGLTYKRKTFRRVSELGASLFEDLRGVRFDNICAGLQLFTEDMLCGLVQNAARKTGLRKALAAGGVFMNVKANKRIGELAELDLFEAFPSCGDETLPFGAFWLALAEQVGDAKVPPLRHCYLGDDVTEAHAEQALRASGYPFDRPADVASAVADFLAAGQPVARCAGPMEFGARALGNRSILADPKDQDVVRVINRMVKKRDFWMPFAPMVLERRQHDYLKNPKNLPSPYMMMTYDSRENFRELIAAVHNADLTCRAQILRPGQNPAMEAILEAFEQKTGRGIVLNTSFNLHGYPVVRTPEDALHVFKESGLEYLQVGPFIVRKK